MSWLNPKFKYRGAITHADATSFARRMRARQRIAQHKRQQQQGAVIKLKRTGSEKS